MIGKLIEALGITQRDLIKSIIAEYFFADFGTILAVNGARVDVQHAVQPKLFGQQLPTTVTKGVELLSLGGGSAFALQWTINVGDPVLLIGLRDFVKSAANPGPAPTDIPLHYTQETMKAIPLGVPLSSAPATGAQMNTGAGVQMQSDAVTDPVAWPILTALAAIFGMTLTSMKAGWH